MERLWNLKVPKEMGDDDPIREWVPFDSVDAMVLMLAFEASYGVGGPQDQIERWQQKGLGAMTVNKIAAHLAQLQTEVPKARTWAKTLWGKF